MQGCSTAQNGKSETDGNRMITGKQMAQIHSKNRRLSEAYRRRPKTAYSFSAISLVDAQLLHGKGRASRPLARPPAQQSRLSIRK